MAFQTQQSNASQSAVGGNNPSSSMAQNAAAVQHQAATAATNASSSGLSYMSPYIRQDFLSQETFIEIMPKFELGRIQFLSGKYGPFSPNYPVSVPLWLALFLRETNTCTIRPPREMTVDFLNRVLQFEGDNDRQFHDLPFHFFSIVRQILRYSSSDIPDAAVVHRLIDELEQRRVSKITKNLNVLQGAGLTPPAFALTLTSSEWLFVKSTLQRVINDAVELKARAAQRLHRTTVANQSAAATTIRPDYYQQSSSSLSYGNGSGGTGTESSSSQSQSTMMMMMGDGFTPQHGNNNNINRGTTGGASSMTDASSSTGMMMMSGYYSSTTGGSQDPQQSSTSQSTRTRRSLRG